MSKSISLLIVILVCGILGCKSNTKESLSEEGDALLKQGNFNGAIVHYKNALEKDANYLSARFNLALAYLETGKLEQAERELRKVQLQDPYDLRATLHLARIANIQNKPDVAIPLLESYLKAHPNDAAALEQLAFSATTKGDSMAAREYLEQALVAEPGRVSSRLALAHNFMSQDERSRAREMLDGLLAEQPTNRAALHALARLEFQERDPEGMLDVYSRIASTYPADLFARYKEGSLRLDKGEMDRVKASAEAMIKEFPAKAEGHRLMGRLLFQEGKYKDAATFLQKSISIQPDLETYYLLGQVFFSLGDLEMAVTQFQTILDYTPTFTQARIMLGEIFLRQGRGVEAAAVADKMLEANLLDFRGFSLRADAMLLQSKPREALAALEEAARLAPSNHGVLLKKGLLKLSLADASGEQDLVEALRISPRGLDARMALHTHYVQSKRFDDAERVLREGLDSGKADAVLYNALAKMSFGKTDGAKVLEYLDKAREADPTLLQTYYNAAAVMLAQGKSEDALGQYDLALAVQPLDVRALIGSAFVLDGQGKVDAARERLEKARSTGDVGAILMLTRYLQRRGFENEAVAVLEDAVRLQPGNVVLIQAKASLHVVRRELDKAMTLYDQLEGIDPWFGTMERTRAWMSVGDMDKAERSARRLIGLSPEKGDSYAPLAAIQDARKDRPAAEKLLREGLSRDPDNARAGVLLGEFFIRGHELDKALNTFEDVSRRVPMNAPALTGKGMALQLLGRKDEAAQAYVQAIQARNDHAPALNNLAMLWADDDKTRQQALNLAMAAFTKANTDPAIIDTLGYALLRNNRLEEALRVLDRAVALAGDNGAIHYHRALTLNELDRRQDAVAALESALGTGDFEDRAEAEKMLHALQGTQ